MDFDFAAAGCLELVVFRDRASGHGAAGSGWPTASKAAHDRDPPVMSPSELTATISRLEATRRQLLGERRSLLDKLETIDLTLQQLNERLQRYRRAESHLA